MYVEVYLNRMRCEMLGLQYTFTVLPAECVLISHFDSVIPRMDDDKRSKFIELIDWSIKQGKSTMTVEYKSNQPGWFIIRA